MNKKNIQLELSFEDINLILKALGQLPFNQVYELIGAIHEQANMQIQQDEENFNWDSSKLD